MGSRRANDELDQGPSRQRGGREGRRKGKVKRQRESQKPTDSYRDSKELTVGKHVRSQSHSIPRRFPDGKTPGCEKPPVTTPVAAGRERHSRGAGANERLARDTKRLRLYARHVSKLKQFYDLDCLS